MAHRAPFILLGSANCLSPPAATVPGPPRPNAIDVQWPGYRAWWAEGGETTQPLGLKPWPGQVPSSPAARAASGLGHLPRPRRHTSVFSAKYWPVKGKYGGGRALPIASASRLQGASKCSNRFVSYASWISFCVRRLSADSCDGAAFRERHGVIGVIERQHVVDRFRAQRYGGMRCRTTFRPVPPRRADQLRAWSPPAKPSFLGSMPHYRGFASGVWAGPTTELAKRLPSISLSRKGR